MAENANAETVSSTASLEIRTATEADLPEIAEIYRYYVETSAVTFEYTAPGVNELRNNMNEILKRYPYFVAKRNGRVVGFCYAGALRKRPAYGWSCETTIYISPDQRRTGAGSALYEALEAALVQMGILGAYACVACPTCDDEFLTDASLQFHKHMGYAEVGKFDNCGNKFGHWYDIAWLKKDLGPHCPNPQPVTPFSELNER